MKVVVQKCLESSVKVDGKLISEIGKGLMVLVGFTHTDTLKDIDYLVNKVVNLRIFEDENDVMNRSVIDEAGEILCISQFTLYADCKHGNRPGFTDAAKPDLAIPFYEYICDECRKEFPDLGTGIFGADMKISLLNDGPFTIVLDSNEIM